MSKGKVFVRVVDDVTSKGEVLVQARDDVLMLSTIMPVSIDGIVDLCVARSACFVPVS